MNKHTPGPWEVFICDDGGQWTGWPLSIDAVNDEDKTIVRPGGFYPYEWDAATSQREAVSNARLIASAPDLLEALEEVSRFMIPGMNWTDETGVLLKNMARAAIAKAKGEEQ